MNDRMYESLSALMDNEANDLELERVLVRLASDAGLRQAWMRYNLTRHAVHGHSVAYVDLDISARVQSALAGSQMDVSGHRGTLAVFKQRMLRPIVSFAVAASVAATVVIGGQQLAQVGVADPYGIDRPMANGASPVGMLNSLGATAVQASYGTQPVPVLQPAARTAYQELAQQRLNRYMQEHVEQAALNSPQGLVPFARVPQIRE
jgi:sigma-E factor negative regulatory protein RseA